MKTFLCAVGLLLASALTPTNAALETRYLVANGLNFTCTVLNHIPENGDAPVKNIMMLHGFPMFRVWWLPLLQYWDELLGGKDELTRNTTKEAFSSAMLDVSVNAVACDLRGYSPGASPDNIEEYDYSIFAEDTFTLAKAAGFDQGFHLLGHDHGAGLAWYVAGNDPDNQVLSLTTMAVPHVDLLSDALCGDNTDKDQVVASNYFNQFSLSDSAIRNNHNLTNLFTGFGMELEPAQFQKMLWWYNGSLAKHFSLPRVVSDAEVGAYATEYGTEATDFLQGTRQAIPMEERPCMPVEEAQRVGAIEVPTLFICGVDDSALLCNNSYATDYTPELLPKYEHANYNCGHDFFLEGQCNSMAESRAVMEKITAFVLGYHEKDEAVVDIPPESSGQNEETEWDSASNTSLGDGSGPKEVDSSDDSVASSASPIVMFARNIPLLMASGGAVMASSSLCW